MTRVFIAIAAATMIGASGIAFAADGSNPAPEYPSSGTGQSSGPVQPIQDSTNGAPQYPSTGTGKSSGPVQPIQDATNGAPQYPSTAAAKPSAPRSSRHAKSKTSTTHQQARTKRHSPASHT
jgi:hypothetical protein